MSKLIEIVQKSVQNYDILCTFEASFSKHVQIPQICPKYVYNVPKVWEHFEHFIFRFFQKI